MPTSLPFLYKGCYDASWRASLVSQARAFIRVITLKSEDHLAASIGGVPDLLSTRVLCFGLAALFLVIALGLPAAFVFWPIDPDLDPMVPAMLFVCSALAGLLVFIFARTGLRAGAWFIVDPSGFHYGDGRIDRAEDRRGAMSVAWEHVVSNRDAACDVRIVLTNPHRGLPMARIGVWIRSPDDHLVEHSIPMALIANRLGCLRFLNADAVRIALLRGLAARPGLRFHPDVFIKARVNPETWRSTSGGAADQDLTRIIRFQIADPDGR